MFKIVRKIEKWEIHHKVAFFNFIVGGTIFIVRGGVQFYNPYPSFLNFELHHFDYGMVLLLITCLLLLFHRRTSHLYLIMAGVAFGLILDELWFVRGNLAKEAELDISYYNATLFSALVLAKVITIATLMVSHIKKRKELKLQTQKINSKI